MMLMNITSQMQHSSFPVFGVEVILREIYRRVTFTDILAGKLDYYKLANQYLCT
jgi:hypothetical protein